MKGREEYTLFFDESGDHFRVDERLVDWRYLGLIGVAVRHDRHNRLNSQGGHLDRFKTKHIPAHRSDRPVILVRRQIVDRKGPFAFLQDEDKRAAFDDDLLALLSRFDYRIFAVVLDKHTHNPRDYRHLQHPYHYALHALLERYCGWLRYIGAVGSVTAEARGKREDRELREAYSDVWESGTVGGYMAAEEVRRTLSSDRVTLMTKKDNVAGLQLADLLANPLTRDVLQANGRIPEVPGVYGKKVTGAVQGKYNRREDTGRIEGYGRVLLK